MSDMIDAFLDVDFERDPNYVFGDLGVQLFGNSLSDYAASEEVLTDAEIRDAIEKIDEDGGGLDRLVTRIYNQKNEGSCVANACSQANEIIQAKQFGKDRVVPLSAISLYKRIGRSPNSGAMVSDGLKEMQTRGILPLDTPENRIKYGDAVMPNTGFRTPYPADWEATAKQFAGVEALIVRSVNALLTALINGHPVVVGRQGHSICYVRPMMRNGRRVVKYANSWGDWGDGGYGYDSESQIRQSASWAFALRTVVRRS
jgi:hypothetical protein